MGQLVDHCGKWLIICILRSFWCVGLNIFVLKILHMLCPMLFSLMSWDVTVFLHMMSSYQLQSEITSSDQWSFHLHAPSVKICFPLSVVEILLLVWVFLHAILSLYQPFWRLWNPAACHGRGVIGVLRMLVWLDFHCYLLIFTFLTVFSLCSQVFLKLILLNQLMISRALNEQLFLQDLKDVWYKCRRITGMQFLSGVLWKLFIYPFGHSS